MLPPSGLMETDLELTFSLQVVDLVQFGVVSWTQIKPHPGLN